MTEEPVTALSTEAVSADQAEGLTADALGVESALREALNRAERMTRTLAALTRREAVADLRASLAAEVRTHIAGHRGRIRCAWTVDDFLRLIEGDTDAR